MQQIADRHMMPPSPTYSTQGWSHIPQGSAADGGLMLLAVLLVALATFHPYYFGDELFPLGIHEAAQDRFSAVYGTLNSYKPRLVFNALWAAIAALEVGRWLPMMVFVLCTAGICTAAYLLARRTFDASRMTALLVALAIICSRFGVMLRHDYIAGIIETSSLLFFLTGLVLLLRSGDEMRLSRGAVAATTLAFLAAVLCHERYLAATTAIGGLLVLRALLSRGRGPWKRILGAAVVISAVPLVFFVVATELIADLPLATGTAGMKITVGVATVTSFLHYASNVFLGTNYGHPWFVGQLPEGVAGQRYAFAFVTVLLLGWAFWAWGFRQRKSWGAVIVLGSAVALMAVASLPGPDRQEARWMFPVAALVAVFVASASRHDAQRFLLAVFIAVSLTYGFVGRQELTYNIVASHTARHLADALTAVVPPGRTGAVLEAREPDISWALGGGSYGPGLAAPAGVAFSRLNLPDGTRLFPVSMGSPPGEGGFDFGVLALPGSPGSGPRHVYLDGPALTAVLKPDHVPADAGQALGHDATWSGWRWTRTPDMAGGARLQAGMDGFHPVDASMLAGRVLLYRARSEGPGRVAMRLQINWMDAKEQLVEATIKVVEVGPEPATFSMAATPPPAATEGYVYATLHDGASGTVRLISVRLL